MDQLLSHIHTEINFKTSFKIIDLVVENSKCVLIYKYHYKGQSGRPVCKQVMTAEFHINA